MTTNELTKRGHLHEGKNAIEWFAASFHKDALDDFCLRMAMQLRDADMAEHFIHSETVSK